MQELCKSKVSWDQSLEGQPLTKWCKLIDLMRHQPVVIPDVFSVVHQMRQNSTECMGSVMHLL